MVLGVAVAAVVSLACLIVPFVAIWRLNELSAGWRRWRARLEVLERTRDQDQLTRERPMRPRPRPRTTCRPQPSEVRSPHPPELPLHPARPVLTTTEAARTQRTTTPHIAGPRGRLGEQWMSTPAAVLLLGVAFFLKYAFEQAWVTPAARARSGVFAGVAMIPVGLRIAGRGYKRYGHGCRRRNRDPVSHNLRHPEPLALVDPGHRRGSLLLGTIAGAALTQRRTAPAGTSGRRRGYATPLLVGGSRNAHITLFWTLALLTAVTIPTLHAPPLAPAQRTAYV